MSSAAPVESVADPRKSLAGSSVLTEYGAAGKLGQARAVPSTSAVA
jgi:hypothetical protein